MHFKINIWLTKSCLAIWIRERVQTSAECLPTLCITPHSTKNFGNCWDGHLLTRVLGRARLTRLAKAVVRVGTAAFGLRDSPGEGAGTGALLDAPVAGAADVGVHANPPVHADGQAAQTLAAE